MKYAIYGAGSLGTVMGAYLTKNGVDIELVNRNRAHVAEMRKNGARVCGAVSMTVPVKAILPEEMEGEYSVIFLMTKQLQNDQVVSFLKPFLSEDGVIVTLQNGLPENGIAKIVGKNRVMGCTVEWGATFMEPGVAKLTSDESSLSFHMGKMDGITDEQFNRVKTLLEKMCPVHTEENLMGARWSKLLINATFSGLATVMGGVFGDVSEGKEARKAALACMKECIDVGRAAGVTFAPVQGKDITRLFYYSNPLKKAFASLLLPIAMKKHRNIEPSMLQDIRKGKPCEVDAINGVVCQWGREYGVPTPVNDRIVELIKQEETGALKPQAQNLQLLKAFM